MQSDNKIIADFVKLANSAAGTLSGITREARDSARERMRERIGGLDFVSREEFEAVKAMAAAARAETDRLAARIAALEGVGTPAERPAAEPRSDAYAGPLDE